MLFNGLQSALDKNWEQDYVDQEAALFEKEAIHLLVEVIFEASKHQLGIPRYPDISELHELFKKCLKWNQRAKSQVFSVDYVSVVLPNKGVFDPIKMQHVDD